MYITEFIEKMEIKEIYLSHQLIKKIDLLDNDIFIIYNSNKQILLNFYWENRNDILKDNLRYKIKNLKTMLNGKQLVICCEVF